MRPVRLLSIAGLAAMLALLLPSRADACTVSATGVAFGAYDPQSLSPDDGTGTISVSCHNSVSAPVIALSPGTSGVFTSRTMTSGQASLSYNLYTNASRTIVWGYGYGYGASNVTLTGGIGSGGRRLFSTTVYGRIPARQNVPAGTYGDTIVVTVVF